MTDEMKLTEDVIRTQRGKLEKEIETLLESVNIRRRAIGKLQDVIAILNNSSEVEDDRGIVATRHTKYDPTTISNWVMEFASAQSKPFTTTQILEWFVESGKIETIPGRMRRIVRDIMHAERFGHEGEGAHLKWTPRPAITTHV